MKNILNKIREYFTEAFIELKKVKWPTRQQTLSLTAAVVIISGFVAVLMAAYDLGLVEVRNFLLGEKQESEAAPPLEEGVPFEIPEGVTDEVPDEPNN